MDHTKAHEMQSQLSDQVDSLEDYRIPPKYLKFLNFATPSEKKITEFFSKLDNLHYFGICNIHM